MIKAKINKTEVRLLRDGSFRCKDPVLLELVLDLSKHFDSGYHSYHPNPQLGKMQWIVEQLSGTITHADPIDYSKYPDDVCFSSV